MPSLPLPLTPPISSYLWHVLSILLSSSYVPHFVVWKVVELARLFRLVLFYWGFQLLYNLRKQVNVGHLWNRCIVVVINQKRRKWGALTNKYVEGTFSRFSLMASCCLPISSSSSNIVFQALVAVLKGRVRGRMPLIKGSARYGQSTWASNKNKNLPNIDTWVCPFRPSCAFRCTVLQAYYGRKVRNAILNNFPIIHWSRRKSSISLFLSLSLSLSLSLNSNAYIFIYAGVAKVNAYTRTRICSPWYRVSLAKVASRCAKAWTKCRTLDENSAPFSVYVEIAASWS